MTSEAIVDKNKYECDIIILGQHNQKEVHYLRTVLETIKRRNNQSAKFQFIIEFETQFNFIYEELLQKNNDFIDYQGQSPIIYSRDQKKIIGNFVHFKKYITENFSYLEEKEPEDFESVSLSSHRALLNSGYNHYAFLEISPFVKSNEKDYSNFSNVKNRTVVIELFFQICPKTVMNFLEICKGTQKNKKAEKLNYSGCEIFRVIKNGYIQSGDLNHLSSYKSIYGEPFEDENYTVKHDRPGILGSVKNRGKSHSNESQFYITLNSLNHFDGMFVAFGRIVQGFDVIKRISQVECYLQRPKEKITIDKCGVYTV